jgi:hypothetical protein
MAKVSAGGETYEFDPQKFLNVELIAVERETGFTSFEWQSKLASGSAIAATALFWVLRKRKGLVQQFDEIEFDMSTLVVDFRTPEEVAAAEKVEAEAKAKKEAETSDSTPTPPDDLSPTPTTTTSSSSSSVDG